MNFIKNEKEFHAILKTVFDRKDTVKAGSIHSKDLDDSIKQVFILANFKEPNSKEIENCTGQFKATPDGKIQLYDLENATKKLIHYIIEQEK